MLDAERPPNAVKGHAVTAQVDFEIDRPPPPDPPPLDILITMVKELRFCIKRDLANENN